MMSKELLTPREVEHLFRFPHGRAVRLARKGAIPHVMLPTVGKERPEFRFIRSQIDDWLASGCPPARESGVGAVD